MDKQLHGKITTEGLVASLAQDVSTTSGAI